MKYVAKGLEAASWCALGIALFVMVFAPFILFATGLLPSVRAILSVSASFVWLAFCGGVFMSYFEAKTPAGSLGSKGSYGPPRLGRKK